MPDKYTATWVSHSSISDFLLCPRSYYFKNIYRNPKSGNKVKLMSPPLALGTAVHEVLEGLSTLPTLERFKEPLGNRFERAWQFVAGLRGGFYEPQSELRYKNRGVAMLSRVTKNPGQLAKQAVKIKMNLPYFWLSDADNIILCGKIDWLEHLSYEDSVHIIDFKTSKHAEPPNSLQLPIYYLLAQKCQKRPVAKASYWYLESHDTPIPQALPDSTQSHRRILEIAREIKLARKLASFKCPQGSGGCWACTDMEKIVNGKAQFVGRGSYGEDIFVLNNEDTGKSTLL